MLAVALAALLAAAPATELKSPDGRLVATVALRNGTPVYSLACAGRPVLVESQLGLTLTPALPPLTLVAQSTTSHDETWKSVYGERSSIRDHYNQLDLDLGPLALTFRAYDEGLAWCYTLAKRDGVDQIHIARENTEFRFAADYRTWTTYSAQGNYVATTLAQVKPGCERPLTVELAPDLYTAIGEAKLVDYARLKLAPLPGVPHALVSDLSGPVVASLPLTTPWRFVLVAPSPGRLLEQNYLLLNLNDPCALADTSWIKPGKVIRETSLTTVGGKACVDFAVKRGLQYIEFDAGWYGHEYDPRSDARDVHLDPKRSRGPLDLHEVIRYADEHGIGVILYVNHLALERQIDEILPLYRTWGVKGVKYGFVNVGSQRWTSWLHEAVRKAAANHLLVDIHDEYRPTGYSRTYPNLLTQEGISGDETSPLNTQTLTVQFTRMLAGAADNTICYQNERVDKNATHAYQLAKAVCLYSPFQFLFWYDRPAGVPDSETELEFYNHCPTVWDDTRVLSGAVGNHAVIARRSAEDWFIGAMHAGEARTFEVPLSFLTTGTAYTAHLYEDDPAVATPSHVRCERRVVKAGDALRLALVRNGGAAVWLEATKP